MFEHFMTKFHELPEQPTYKMPKSEKKEKSAKYLQNFTKS